MTPARLKEQAVVPPRQRHELGFRISVWAMVTVLLLRSPANLIILGWFTETYRDTSAASEVSHRLHEVAFGVFFTLALVGAVSLLTNPRRNLAGLLQLTTTLVTLTAMVTSTLGADYWLLLFLIPLAGILSFYQHYTPVRDGKIRVWALVLLFLVVPVFLSEIAGNLARAGHGAQNHTTHWSAMAAFTAVLLLLGLIVAIRIRGERLVGWSLGIASILYGLASLAFPYDASSHRPAFSIFLISWGGLWLLGPVLFDRDRALTKRAGVAVVVGSVVLAPIIFTLAVAMVPSIDTPPNVPHRPDPNMEEMSAGDVDGGTCLECHSTGIVGAPLIPHEPDRTCEHEPCWGGRQDCAGCHRIDPALGGPTEQIFIGDATSLSEIGSARSQSYFALSSAEIYLLRELSSR